MVNSVTVNGVTYTDDDNASTGLANGGHRTRFIPCLSNALIDFAVKQAAAASANGVLAITYTFDTTTTDADPAAGKLRLGNATQNAATVIRTDLLDSLGVDWTAVLDTFDASTNAVKGQVRLSKVADGSKWLTFNLTARAAPAGYRNLTVTNTGSSAASPFANGDSILLSFTRTGDLGATGAAGTLSGSASGSINFARATVASHATTADIWGALGNQIDWTGTATTTIFPNAPQAGAERVLICAGACSFTAGANMLIDGVASAATVTCAANDQVIVRAVSATQFKLSRVKYDGTAQVASGVSTGDSCVTVHTGNGHGSTNTKIRRFTTAMINVGTAITYADSAANGGAFTINEAGMYSIFYADTPTAADTMGASVNSTQLTTNINSITLTNRLMMTIGASAYTISVSGVFLLAVNDVIRAHTGGGPSDITDKVWFSIRKIGNA